MEDLSKRFPIVNRLILKNLDDRTLINFKETSRGINQVFQRFSQGLYGTKADMENLYVQTEKEPNVGDAKKGKPDGKEDEGAIMRGFLFSSSAKMK